MIEPLIHAEAEGGCTEFLAKLGGEESLIYLTGIEARHTGLDVLTVVILGLSVDIAILIIICALIGSALQIDDRHWSLVNHRTTGMIVLQGSLPVQTVVKTVAVHEGYLTCLIQTSIVERSLLQLTSTHIAISHLVIDRKIRGGTELEVAILLYASIAHIDKWSTLGSVVIHVVAVGILIHGSELTTIAVILLGEESLVNLSTVLIRS